MVKLPGNLIRHHAQLGKHLVPTSYQFSYHAIGLLLPMAQVALPLETDGKGDYWSLSKAPELG